MVSLPAMFKLWKLQEGQEVIPLPRSLVAYGPLPFCGDRGRSPRIGGRRGRTYGVGTYPGQPGMCDFYRHFPWFLNVIGLFNRLNMGVNQMRSSQKQSGAAPRNQMSRSGQERYNRNESLGFKTLCWRWTGMSLRTLAGLSDDPRGGVAYVIRAGALDSVLHQGPTLADPSFVLFNPPADLMSCLTRGSETRDWVHSTCSEISRGLEPWSENQQTDSCTTSILSL